MNPRLNNPPAAGLVLVFALSSFCAPYRALSGTLPAEVPINSEAGRGGLLIAPVKLESGAFPPTFPPFIPKIGQQVNAIVGDSDRLPFASSQTMVYRNPVPGFITGEILCLSGPSND